MASKRDIHLIIGGCRSGKSSHALKLADTHAGETNIFLATCVPSDEEMKERVARHKAERDPKWSAIEAPLAVADAIRSQAGSADVILVDCLTLWITNLMMAYDADEAVVAQADDLAAGLKAANCPVYLVSNEVGTGIVPENAMARRFRDLAGFVNQRMAEAADAVTWMVAGIPVRIK